MANLEPPNMGILKDKSQLEFYTAALERWATLATHSGIAEDIQADLVLAHAFNQAPDLCKEMTEHFGNTLKGDAKGVDKIVTFLQTKFGLNKHADMVKILNNFLNTSRHRGENLINFISRFERNYAEVKKMGETFSPTCLSKVVCSIFSKVVFVLVSELVLSRWPLTCRRCAVSSSL